MTPFDLAASDRQQARDFDAALDDIRLDREAFAREELTPRERYRRHFDACNGTRDPNWRRLTGYRNALLLLEACQDLRLCADEGRIDRKFANVMWERNFEAAQIARKVLAYELRESA